MFCIFRCIAKKNVAKNAKMIYNLEPRDCSGLLFEMLCIFRCIAKKFFAKNAKTIYNLEPRDCSGLLFTYPEPLGSDYN